MTRLEELRDQVYNLNEGRVADAVLELLAIEIERAKDDDETRFANSECERKGYGLIPSYGDGVKDERQLWIDAVRKCVVWPLDDHRKILAATTEAFAKEIFKRMGVTDEPN